MPDYAVLIDVLNQQSNVVDDLIELGLAETEAFKIDDVPRILTIVERQKEAVDRMCALERRRAELMDGHKPLRGMTPMNGRVMDAVSCLIERARKLQKINETNRLLARMSLSYTRMMQKALGVAANGSYDQKGTLTELRGSLGKLNASA
jgi:flagellar biosynthesis/type III secretory pathway chaperone